MTKKPSEKRLPTPEELRALLDYDPDTGVLTWKRRPCLTVGDARFNTRNAYKTAGNRRGRYICVSIYDAKHQAHRVIWALVYGVWPPEMIDHIDGDGTNNRLQNLRLATRSQNMENRFAGRNNSSGHVGLIWRADRERWYGQIVRKTPKGRVTYRTRFYRNKQDAIEAYQKMRAKVFHFQPEAPTKAGGVKTGTYGNGNGNGRPPATDDADAV